MNIDHAIDDAIRWLAQRALKPFVRELATIVLHSPSRSMMGTCECPSCKSSAARYFDRLQAVARQSRRRLRELRRRQADDVRRKRDPFFVGIDPGRNLVTGTVAGISPTAYDDLRRMGAVGVAMGTYVDEGWRSER